MASSPFIPGKSLLLWQSLGLQALHLSTAWAGLERPAVAGLVTTKPEALFPKPASV